jgi:hypothetical protein
MKAWQVPQLLHYGSFEAVTQQSKTFLAPFDGVTFFGTPLGTGAQPVPPGGITVIIPGPPPAS